MPDQTIILPKAPREALIARISRVLGALPADRAWAVSISEYRPKRSSQQNKLLWSLYAQAIERSGETLKGYTREELHEVLLEQFFGFEKFTLFGMEKTRALGRSRSMDKQTFSDYVEHIVMFMAGQGIVLDLPEDDWR